ncbi:LacI family transcriptional regulator [Intestinibaculum porci]|uniref:LacI family transcriptional regulator n=1 Tax=Intestinibaculum porci TaxID=2487118 RepID=A0A3G9JNN9_9FIRM|nr:LacI family DNA-binding transcriptional regulator [Intestinibaculum porci]BBH27621.1 LacI family transcriptional regulator [Intestinibaculum porci]
MQKKITFDDIAKYTHFSKTTISRYFNHPETLTEKNRAIIKDALEKLNYHENKLAKVLANGKSEFIGIIVPNLSMHYYAEMLSHILATYQEFGYKFLVFESNDDPVMERQYISELIAYNIEGMIILSHCLSSQELSRLPIPIVTIERESQFLNGVTTDNYRGALIATSYLQSLNCDILIHINSELTPENPDYERTHGFLDICEKEHLPHQLIAQYLGATWDETNTIYEDLFQQIDTKYQGQKKGIFIANDTHANIFLNIVYRHYRNLPEDYNIIGFDDSSISREALIPITTIHQNIDTLSHAAMELLVDQIQNKKSKQLIHRQVEPSLIIRHTTH